MHSVLKSSCKTSKKTATGPDRHQLQLNCSCWFGQLLGSNRFSLGFWANEQTPVKDWLKLVFYQDQYGLRKGLSGQW